MNIVLTLDYEVFFGHQGSGTRRSLIEPTEALRQVAERHGVPLVVFVDVLWLLRLAEGIADEPALATDWHMATRQLEALARAGHELQLHLHPHWNDCRWTGQRWIMDMRRYRLQSLDEGRIGALAFRGARLLRSLSDGAPVSAFRAGGWCLQPFGPLRQPLLDAGIRIDSTVYPGGHQTGATHHYDFTQAPAMSRWHFDTDPLQPVHNGAFLEVPIASVRAAPSLYWRMALVRKAGLERHRTPGGGEALRPSRADLLRKLLTPTVSVASFDGLKADLLDPALAAYRRRGLSDFVILGHPKALTPHGLGRLDAFLAAHRREHFVGLNDYLRHLAPLQQPLPPPQA